MFIESIEKITRIKYKVSTEAGLLYLYTGDLRRYRLKAGEDLPDDIYEVMLKETLIPRCRRKAMDILTRSDRTEKELRDKLKRAGFTSDLVEDAVAYVNKYHYINDERVAVSYIGYKGTRKSSRELSMELTHKGIDKDIAARLIEENANDEEAIDAAIRRRTGGRKNIDDVTARKLYGYLYRHGFEPDLIRDKVNSLKNDDCSDNI